MCKRVKQLSSTASSLFQKMLKIQMNISNYREYQLLPIPYNNQQGFRVGSLEDQEHDNTSVIGLDGIVDKKVFI
ncbi:MAG: hypothetical protein IJY54_08280 [Paludibacteraceae bacterium]|nr:hypothetical protein [Paludibacteraceae bacterium]